MNFFNLMKKLQENAFGQPNQGQMAQQQAPVAQNNIGAVKPTVQQNQGQGVGPSLPQDPALANILKLLPTIKDHKTKEMLTKSFMGLGLLAQQNTNNPAQQNVNQVPNQPMH